MLIVVTGVLFRTLWHAHPAWLAASPDSLERGRWWTVLTALVVPDSLIELLLTLALALTVLAYAERMLGSLRCALMFVVTGVCGVLVGVGVQEIAEAQGAVWAKASGEVLDPAIGVAGAVLAASGLAPVLFRRRIRLVGLSLLLMFVLYGGDADSMYRLIAALIGLGIGALLARRRLHGPWHRSSYSEARTLIAAVVAVTGLGPLIVLLTGIGIGPLSPVVAGLRGTGVDAILTRCADDLSDRCVAGIGFSIWSTLMSLVPVLLSVVAAAGLIVGRRAAWILALVVNAVTAVLIAVSIGVDDLRHPAELVAIDRAFPGFAIVASVVPLAVCAVLILTRRRFGVRAGRGEGRRFAVVALVALGVLAGVDVVVALTSGGSIGFALLDALRRFLPPGFAHGRTATRFGAFATAVRHMLGPLFWAVFVIGVVRLLRAPALGEGGDGGERYRELLRAGAARPAGTLGFLGTGEGNRHWFTDDGRGAVAYRVVSGIAIAVADPAGTDAAATVRGFADFCDRQGWMPVLYSVHDEVLPVAVELGWSHLPVGEETVVPLERFGLEGKAWAKVRQPYRRGARDGLRAEWARWQDLPAGLVARLDALSEQWVAEKALPEMGFTLGGVDELKDPEVALMLAIGPDGALQAVTSWLPVWQDGERVGWTLDFMRRADDAMPGVMEFLIASAALRMKEEGLAIMSLSGAPLATAQDDGTAADPDTVSELLSWLGRVLEPAYGFRSLLAFKSKFHPEYRALHMVYPDPARLPAVGLALARAYLPKVTTREYVALARTLRRAP
ncbi:MAG: DUF2156 domain-containing protein [Microbacterium sp.]